MIDETSPTSNPSRFAFLDALRGIAALAVVITHILEEVSPEFHSIRGTYFDLGSCAVTVFFLCSGFIIPVSLERVGSIRKFWIRRIFRLYPLYWISVMLVVLVFILLPEKSLTSFNQHPVATTLAHLTMFQILFGMPNIVAPYWTLFFEMIFYIIVTFLFITGGSKSTKPVVVGLLLGTIFVEIIMPLFFHQIFAPALIGVFLMMFNGTLLYRVYTKEVTVSSAAVIRLLSMITLFGITVVRSAVGLDSIFYMGTGWITGYIIFIAVFLIRAHQFPRPLLYLGQISYSLYLLHPVILLAVPQSNSIALTITYWLMIMLVISALTYRWLEQPMMRVGKRLSRDPIHAVVPGAPPKDEQVAST